MSAVHIHQPWRRGTIKTPWWASHERFGDLEADARIWTDCCACKVRADETVCQITRHIDLPLGWMDAPHEPWDQGRETGEDFASYYDPLVQVRCGPGLGCNANAKKRRGKAAREFWRYAA